MAEPAKMDSDWVLEAIARGDCPVKADFVSEHTAAAPLAVGETVLLLTSPLHRD